MGERAGRSICVNGKWLTQLNGGRAQRRFARARDRIQCKTARSCTVDRLGVNAAMCRRGKAACAVSIMRKGISAACYRGVFANRYAVVLAGLVNRCSVYYDLKISGFVISPLGIPFAFQRPGYYCFVVRDTLACLLPAENQIPAFVVTGLKRST